MIEKLVLTDIEASEGFAELGESLRTNTYHSLSHIDFSHNSIKDKGIVGLAAGFEVMRNQ